MTTDNRTLAAQHADSLIESIRERCEYGAPFGVQSDDEGWSDDLDALADYRDNEDAEWEESSAYDYLEDALDIQYLVNSDRTYRAARVLISFGGPNVWIDTNTSQLEVYWSGSEYRQLPSEFVEALDDTLTELWEMSA